jgi:hypothetical protein
VAGKRQVGGGGRGGEGGGRWRGRACAKEGGARETSATSATVTRGVVAAVTVAVWRRGRRRGRMIPVREEEVKGETRC